MDGILHKQKKPSIQLQPAFSPLFLPNSSCTCFTMSFLFLAVTTVWRIQWEEAHLPPATSPFPSPGVKPRGHSVPGVQPGCQHSLSPEHSSPHCDHGLSPSRLAGHGAGSAASPEQSSVPAQLTHPATAGAAEELQSSQPVWQPGAAAHPGWKSNTGDTHSQARDPK